MGATADGKGDPTQALPRSRGALLPARGAPATPIRVRPSACAALGFTLTSGETSGHGIAGARPAPPPPSPRPRTTVPRSIPPAETMPKPAVRPFARRAATRRAAPRRKVRRPGAPVPPTRPRHAVCPCRCLTGPVLTEPVLTRPGLTGHKARPLRQGESPQTKKATPARGRLRLFHPGPSGGGEPRPAAVPVNPRRLLPRASARAGTGAPPLPSETPGCC